MLLTLREELRSGIWPLGAFRTQTSLRTRFRTTHHLAGAVVRVLRDEGLIRLDGVHGVQAVRPGTRTPHGPLALIDLIVQTVRQRLTDQTYPPGRRLPSQQEIAAEFDTSMTTVRQALCQLSLEGLLRPHYSYETSGTYAVDPSREAREALLLADLQAATRRGRWTRAEYPGVVEHALHVLVGSAARAGAEP